MKTLESARTADPTVNAPVSPEIKTSVTNTHGQVGAVFRTAEESKAFLEGLKEDGVLQQVAEIERKIG